MAFERLRLAARILSTKSRPADELPWTSENRAWLPMRQGVDGQWVSSYLSDEDSFENAYANMAAIARAGREVHPFLVDDEGNQLEATSRNAQAQPALNVLARTYSPNEQMSESDYFEALILKYLATPRFYVRIHHTKRRANRTIAPESITGFTFLEGVQVLPDRDDHGKRRYRVGTQYFDEMEVMTFGGINPLDLTRGYSPLTAVRRWIRIEDFMADYQTAFFRNGAVPSGMFTIVASSEQEYLDIKSHLQRTTRGAKNNNNVLYNYQPVDPVTGSAGQAQITWTPFNVQNKDMALKDLNEIAETKQNEAFGVSAVIKGSVDETTYASALVIDKFFVKYTLKPIVSAIWRRYTHELNRCTGGFGYAFSFELEVPILNDERIQHAEAKKTDAETLLALAKSFTIDSIVEAFEYPEEYKKLKPLQDPASPPEPTPDAPAIDTGADDPDDAEDAPRQASAKAIDPDERRDYEQQLRDDIANYTEEEIERLVAEYQESQTIAASADETQDDRLKAILAASVLLILASRGQREQSAALAQVLKTGGNAPALSAYAVSDDLRAKYDDYLTNVAKSYNAQTREQVLNAIRDAIERGVTASALQAELKRLGLAEYRARRLAVSETNRAANYAAVDAHSRVSQELDGQYYVKEWVADGDNPCATCLALHGTDTPVNGVFVPKGAGFNDADGNPVENTFVDMETADAHPNCNCHLRFELRSR